MHRFVSDVLTTVGSVVVGYGIAVVIGLIALGVYGWLENR